MTAVIIGLGILGWLALSLVLAVACGELLKSRAAHLNEIAVRQARDGMGWPKL